MGEGNEIIPTVVNAVGAWQRCPQPMDHLTSRREAFHLALELSAVEHAFWAGFSGVRATFSLMMQYPTLMSLSGTGFYVLVFV